MWKIWIVVGVVLAGCKQPDDGSKVIRQLEGFSIAMCACTNKACVDRVNEDMTKWGQEMAKQPNDVVTPTPEMTKHVSKIMEKYTSCMTKVLMAEAPPGQ